MFDGVPLPADQFHQLMASSRAASAPSSSSLPLPHHHPQHLPPSSTLIPFHGFVDPFPNPNPTPIPPPPPPPHHHLLHLHHNVPTSLLLHHKDHAVGVEQEEIKGRSPMLPMSTLNFDIDARVFHHPVAESATNNAPWSNEEVVALLRIGSNTENWYPEVTWEHVSRKLLELGFRRSADKCKEKFEEQTRSSFHNNINININYSKHNNHNDSNNNNYRLLVNELDDLYDHHHRNHPTSPPQQQLLHHQVPGTNNNDNDCGNVEKPMEGEDKEEEEGERGEEGEKVGQNNVMEEANSRAVETTLFNECEKRRLVDEERDEDQLVAKKKRRMEKFEMFRRFCKSIVERLISQQEEMHNKLLEDMMRRDREMVEKEEAWKKTEMERLDKELDMRAQEQAAAGDRQATIIEFLKRFTSPTSHECDKDVNRDPSPNPINDSNTRVHTDSEPKMASTTAGQLNDDRPNLPPTQALISYNSNSSSTPRNVARTSKIGEGSDTGKRWPREEVQALINLRCTIQGNNEEKDHHHPPGGAGKAPLWERISQGMSELGYSRSAKRCKEKWENINKYFRKTKDNNVNKKRSLDSRTCPYFHQLTALYSQANKPATAPQPENATGSPINHPTSSQETL